MHIHTYSYTFNRVVLLVFICENIIVGLGVHSAMHYLENVGLTYTPFMEKSQSASKRNLKLAFVHPDGCSLE